MKAASAGEPSQDTAISRPKTEFSSLIVYTKSINSRFNVFAHMLVLVASCASFTDCGVVASLHVISAVAEPERRKSDEIILSIDHHHNQTRITISNIHRLADRSSE